MTAADPAYRAALVVAGKQIEAGARRRKPRPDDTATLAMLEGKDELAEVLYAEQKAWPAPLDEAAFHGIAGEIVRTIEPHTEAAPAALLIQTLAMAGNIIGHGPFYQVEADRHYPNIFAVVVGNSSKARKGTSGNRIRSVFAGVDDTWSRFCIQSGLSSGEGLIHAVRDPLADDPGVTDKRLYIAESEFAGLLRVMTRDGNIVSRIIRDAWDRGDLGVMTKSCPTHATDAHISIVGHITNEELTRYLDRTESCNGFANRFIFICAKRSKHLPHGGTLTDDNLKPISRRMAEIMGNARVIERVRMDSDAAVRWEKVYPALSADHPGLFGAVSARAEAQVIRLSLIYALLDGSDTLRAVHLRAALAVWKYAEHSTRVIFGDATGDPVADRIRQALHDAPAGLSRTEISRILGRHTTSERINHALRLIGATSVLIETEGRAAEVWTLLSSNSLNSQGEI